MDQVDGGAQEEDVAEPPGARPWDGEAFRALFDRHLDPVWRFARRRCMSADDAR